MRTRTLDARPREVKILRGLYIFQGVLLWVIALYVIGIRPSASTSYSSGAGLGTQLLFTVLLFLFPLAFLHVARRIVRGGYWRSGLVLSSVSAGSGLLFGISEFFLWVRYSPDQGFRATDLRYLASGVGLLVFGATSLTCIFYLLRPTVRAFKQTTKEHAIAIEKPVMAPKRRGGTFAGIVASVLLWLPVVWIVYSLLLPRTAGPEYLPPMAGTMILLFLLGSNTVGLLFVGLTKSLLKQSRVFGTLFISAGLLNLLLLWAMFGFRFFSGFLGLLIYAPSLVPIIVGVSLIVPLRQLVTRQRNA